MLNVDHLTKRYGTVVAVDGLSFEVGPGRVTGFLGPNGAGKTTTLRMLLGLAAPTSGTATINGVRYRDLPDPARSVGAALEADCFHPGRSAVEHLRIVATAAGIGRRRAAQVLDLVGLTEAGHRRVGTFSLGMRQRLTLATTMLGDPGVLILDEPLNGLDPDGIRWMRDLLGHLAGEGRTVLMSSHLLAEAALTVRGRRGDLRAVRRRGPGSRTGLRPAPPASAPRYQPADVGARPPADHRATGSPGTVEVRGTDPDRVPASRRPASSCWNCRHTTTWKSCSSTSPATGRALEVHPS
jgi:ABC-type Na+ transport system ATPase subunit NatA